MAESVSDISPWFETVTWSANFYRDFSEFASLAKLPQPSIALLQDSNHFDNSKTSL